MEELNELEALEILGGASEDDKKTQNGSPNDIEEGIVNLIDEYYETAIP